ncbi:PREDICTED: ubiquitin carboxyl-terminal hydrolase 47-like [Amphimedon queenslandica]|nr:PREDICTED: ubiquitin carboxyl-terminal hydrolase 47-like [Amphimedon queenslandica]|eukprot:XP_019855524.1 PREDICTED: ubiquitin carboxyl-terminal hydrolase 47-like [Amphimedon queenslandica]
MSTKLSKMKVDYLRSLTSNITDSAASKVRRGMAFEIDDCKFHLEAMTRPDYQPLADNKRIIEKLQERITLMNMELITEREHNEKIMNDIKDHLKEVENKKQRKNKHKTEEMCKFSLYCNHPVTNELITSSLKVHKDELLLTVLDKAYELMKLAPHVPIERCRLVKYDIKYEVMNQSFDLDEFGHLTIGQIVGVARYYSFGLFLETRKVDEIFKKYNDGGINLKISVVDLSTGEVGPAKPVRGEEGWTVGELKQHIGELFDIDSSCMRLVMKENVYRSGTTFRDISDVGITLEKMLYRGGMFNPSKQFYASSDPKDYQKEYKYSLMYRYVDFLVYSIQLNITLPPPQPEATHTTTNVTEGGIIMKIISIDEESKGKERKVRVQVDKRITLAQLKEELVPLIGVPATGFRLCRIRHTNEEYELKSFEILRNIMHQSKLIVRLGRPLGKGEHRIKLYLLQVNNADFCKFMMESIVAEGTLVREFKKQIIEEAKAQGIDYILELDKMRLRGKWRVSPSIVYLDHEVIDTTKKMYVEPLKGPEKIKNRRQMQVYVIRWRPSQCSVDPIEEMILDKDYQEHFIKKLSEFSAVPVEHICCALINSFPVELSCLHVENKLKWYSITSRYSLGLYDYGCVVYYKDNRETMKELTDRERSEIQEVEEARLKRIREYKSQS